jgi:glycerol-3-phosphate acyltransferase PlsX
VRGVCIIGHGSSNDRAIFNGIRVAYEFAKAGTNARIEQEFANNPKARTAAQTKRAAGADPSSEAGDTVQ